MNKQAWLNTFWEHMAHQRDKALPDITEDEGYDAWLVELSTIYSGQGKRSEEETVQALEDAHQRYPNNPHFHVLTAVVLESIGRPVSALHYYLSAYQMGGHQGVTQQAFNRLKATLKRIQRFEEDGFEFHFQGGEERLTYRYDTRDLKRRVQVYEHVAAFLPVYGYRMMHDMNPKEGVPIKLLYDHGVPVSAINEQVDERAKYIYYIFFHLIRNFEDRLPPMLAPQESVLKQMFQNKHGLLFYDFNQEDDEKRFLTLCRSVTTKSKQPLVVSFAPDVNGQEAYLTYIMKNTSYKVKKVAHPSLVLYWLEPDLAEEASLTVKKLAYPKAEHVKESSAKVFLIETAKCVDTRGWHYGVKEEHPFTITLHEMVEDESERDYKASYLSTFYQTEQPRNRYEQLFRKKARRKVRPLTDGWPPLPWNYFDMTRKHISKEAGATREGGNHFHGPNTNQFGKQELKRLKRAYNMMNDGYRPDIFPDGFVEGYLLINDEGDYRFVVSEGQHRIADLIVQGYTEIPVRFAPKTYEPKRVHRGQVSEWPLVKNGVYDEETALQVFDRFFETKA